MVVELQTPVNWSGHRFAFLVRADVEHTEAQKYTGDPRTERVAVCTLLDALDEIGARQSFAVVGSTAELYPDLVREIASRHAVLGHSMDHELPYQGMPLDRQQRDVRRLRAAIEDACGVRIRGLACPFRGMADENTLRAALDDGLEYVLSRLSVAQSKLPRLAGLEGHDRPILVPGGGALTIGDWTDRRRDWPWNDDVFCSGTAARRWTSAIDTAREEGRMCTLVVHPWMLHTNEHELQVLKQVIAYARERGAWMPTYDDLADLVLGRS